MDHSTNAKNLIWRNVHSITSSAIHLFDQNDQATISACVYDSSICVGKHSCASNFLCPWFEQIKCTSNIATMDFLAMLRFQHTRHNICVIDYSNYVMSMKNNNVHGKLFDVISKTPNITYVLIGFKSYFVKLQLFAKNNNFSLQNVRFVVVNRVQTMFCQADDAAIIISSLLGGFLMLSRDKYNHRCNQFDVFCMLTNVAFMTPLVNLVADLLVMYNRPVPIFKESKLSVSTTKYSYCSGCITPKNERNLIKTSANLLFQRSINMSDSKLLICNNNIQDQPITNIQISSTCNTSWTIVKSRNNKENKSRISKSVLFI
jgi:hypothetical protein